MADISQININGTTYTIKDTVARASGGGGLSQLVVVTAEDFAEETITLTNADDGTTLTKTADANGVAKFTVSSAGTWTATADDSGTTVTLGSVTLNVSEINYASDGVKFAFHYSENDSDPDSVTYPEGYDNSNWGSAPAHMDFANNRFEYGAWDPDGANASKLSWLFPKPCMLAYDGTVSYYLDKNDYTKKIDGTASDVANTSFSGNAMMEWGQNGKKIYWKIVPDSDGKGFTFCVADYEVDAGYKCWNHYDCDNTIKDHFYTPIYEGSLINSKERSLSGQTVSSGKTPQQEIDYAKANNPDSDVHWYTEVYADRLLTALLTCLLTKSMDSYTKIGRGLSNTNAYGVLATGTMNDKGMFWGSTHDTTTGVKCWGMENPWGNIHHRLNGMLLVDGVFKTKLTYNTADGTSASSYNLTGSGYESLGSTSNTEGYISHMNITTKGLAPATLSGSNSTYYTDIAYIITTGTNTCYLGGGWNGQKGSGVFAVGFCAATYGDGSIGSSISYR